MNQLSIDLVVLSPRMEVFRVGIIIDDDSICEKANEVRFEISESKTRSVRLPSLHKNDDHLNATIITGHRTQQ